MKLHNYIQGSPEWLAYRQWPTKNASDAPAMMGKSPYKTRSRLLDEISTGLTQDVDSATQRIFDAGHRFEALARPLAESIIGEDLYPVTGSSDEYSASFDGLTAFHDVAFEHKTLNDDIRNTQSIDDLRIDYRIQMEQQLLVSGAEKCLFLATRWDDAGNLLEDKHFWYAPDISLRTDIINGWAQLEKDILTHKPASFVEAPKAETIMQLPAINVQFSGALQSSNLADVTIAFDGFLANANTTLVTDEDFANGEATAKFSRDTAKKLKLTRQQIIDQVADISEATRIIDLYAGKFDALGLQLEKLVKSEKEAIKIKIMNKAASDYALHKSGLEAEINPIRLIVAQPNFAEAMKNKRTLASLHDSVDTELAAAKINADAVAKDIRAKLAWCKETSTGFGFLFNDLSDLIYKAEDDFKLVVTTRIEAHQKAEADKLEEQRKRIQAEEEAKAKAKADAELEAERAKVRVEEQKKIDDERKIYVPPVAIITTKAAVKVTAQNIDDAIAQKRKAEYDKKNPSVVSIASAKRIDEIIRPSDDEILQAVAFYFNADEETVLTWFTGMDLERLCIKAEA